ncbi:hypothetical protein ABTY59_37450 [Streptomyces sp. NPDC096079]|uniref:hypothetical protein n=1 Tax=Streptomyces sp. NPDC096079 TaxID=3155820 RepID=UPI003331FD7B
MSGDPDTLGIEVVQEVLQALVDNEMITEEDANDYARLEEFQELGAQIQSNIETHYGM